MRKKSIFRQLLLPMIAIVCAMAAALVTIILSVFSQSYEKEVYQRSEDKSNLMAGEIRTFLDGAYGVTEELAVNPSILTMDTQIQTPILEDCVNRNTYLELLYIQGTDGMQTGRSGGTLADRSTRWWFIEVMEEQKPFISKSYYSVNTGMPCASIFFPMYRNGQLIGVFAADLKLDYLQTLIETYSDTENGEYSFIIDGEGVVVAHPDSVQIEEQYNYKTLIKTVSDKNTDGTVKKDADGNIITKEEPFELSEEYSALISGVMAGNSGSAKIKNVDGEYYVSYTPIEVKGESDSWSILTVKKSSDAMALVNNFIVIAVGISIAAILVAIIIITMLARRLTTPIVKLTQLIGDASEGNFTVRADESSENELGTLAKSFNDMTKKVADILNKITTFTGQVVQSGGQMKVLEECNADIQEKINEITKGAAGQTQDAEKVVARAAELEEKFQELAEKGKGMAQDAKNTQDSSVAGEDVIEELHEHSSQTSLMMEESYQRIMALNEQSQKISNIVNTINEISSQTSLLALNASIEAARAGEAGRGFAVVAESIGKLASDSGNATADIEKIIQSLCTEISGTVGTIEKIKDSFQIQAEAVGKVGDTFADFKGLADTTLANVDDINELIEQMHKLDRSMVHAAERIRDISHNTADLSEDMAVTLESQTEGINQVAERIANLTKVSEEVERDMTKFQLQETALNEN